MNRATARQQILSELRKRAAGADGKPLPKTVLLPCECSEHCPDTAAVEITTLTALDDETRWLLASHGEGRPLVRSGAGISVVLAEGASALPAPDAEPASLVAQLVIFCRMAGIEVVPRLEVAERATTDGSASRIGRGRIMITRGMLELAEGKPRIFLSSVLAHELAHIEQFRGLTAKGADSQQREILADRRACELVGSSEGIVQMLELTAAAHPNPDALAERLAAARSWTPEHALPSMAPASGLSL